MLRADLGAAEAAQGVTVQEGDILLARTGHARRLAELGPWETATAKAGLHPTAMRFVAERGVAALGSDGNSDTAPSTTESVAFPIHVLALNAMGVHLLDYLQFEDLRAVWERTSCWAFLVVAAPLAHPGRHRVAAQPHRDLLSPSPMGWGALHRRGRRLIPRPGASRTLVLPRSRPTRSP